LKARREETGASKKHVRRNKGTVKAFMKKIDKFTVASCQLPARLTKACNCEKDNSRNEKMEIIFLIEGNKNTKVEHGLTSFLECGNHLPL
jgi:hypothetical protein